MYYVVAMKRCLLDWPSIEVIAANFKVRKYLLGPGFEPG